VTQDELTRFNQLVDNLRVRLRPVCDNWPEALFEEMVRQLADITVKYEVEEGIRVYDRRGTDRLVADMKELLERNQRHRHDLPPEDRV
jgi:hypothetical protein